MTVIVCKDGVMCCDSQVSRGDFIDNTETCKIFEVGNCLIGISGTLVGAMKFVDWFGERYEAEIAQQEFPYVKITPPEELVNKDFQCLVMYPDKTVYEFTGSDEVIECKGDYTAAGSGMFLALAAMDAGASPQEAVEIAIKRDVSCGGEVHTFSVPNEQKPMSEDDIKALDKDQLVNLVLHGTTEDPAPDCVCCDDDAEDNLRAEFVSDLAECPYIFVYKNGLVEDDIGEFTSFVNLFGVSSEWFFAAAETLGVKHAHNISVEKLKIKLDEKVKEIVDELNQ